MKSIAEATLIAGKGIDGDCYFTGKGQFSFVAQDADHEVTLIQSEQVCYLNAQTGAALFAGQFRRNIITSVVDLNELVGKEFKLGKVTLCGMRLGEPYKYLARVSRLASRSAFSASRWFASRNRTRRHRVARRCVPGHLNGSS